MIFSIKTTKRKKKVPTRVDWQKAPDIQKQVASIVNSLNMDWIDMSSIFCFRSTGSKARAYARIWGLSKIWQQALGINSAYCIEILSEKFDHLPQNRKAEVLIHELCHIPKNFSGSLLPHTRAKGKRNFHDRVHTMVHQYSKSK